VVSLIILHQHILIQKYFGEVDPGLARWSSLGIPAVMLLCAIAMVSRIRYVHFANQFLRGTKSYPAMVRLLVVLLLAIWWPQEVLAVAFTAYVFSGPVLAAYRWVRHGFKGPSRREPDEELRT
jgi:phosphatidylserine synthase